MKSSAAADRIQAIPLPVESSQLPWYRQATAALLERYFRVAVETGRLPSVLGGEAVRARSSWRPVRSFEDAVIFVHDMERCLDRLDRVSRQMIARRALQGFTEDETARLLGCSRRHVARLYPLALDRLSAILLRVDLLCPGQDARPWSSLPEEEQEARIARGGRKPVGRVEACQDPSMPIFAVSC